MSRPLLAIAFLTVCAFLVHAADEVYLFSSFRGNGEDGLHLAYSEDGLKWTALDGAKPFLKPKVGGKLMRDPCIIQGPDGLFHLVWTTSWGDRGIGYANSKDLITWSEQQFVPVMEHESTARNCWAPEITWDPDGEQYVIYWATTLPERFTKTAKAADKGWNHRMYCTTTKDFKTYTPTRLFYEPGFNVIDSTIVRDDKRWVLITKDETRHPPAKNLHIATSDKVTGPWRGASEPFTPKGLWVEGPTAAKIGEVWYLYFDCYAKHHYGAMRTKDFETWEDVSDRLEVPKGMRHGTVLAVSREFLAPLLKDQATAPAPALPDLHADPHIACVDGTYYIYPTTDGIEGWKGTNFSCWSSEDLVHWKSEGVILDFGKDLTWTDHRAWAPCIATKNGKYFYYSADQQIGVAVADKPTGPFKDPLGKPLVARGAFQCQTIDPMVFIDDGGAAYLYFGQGNCNVVRLNEDMISFDPAQVKRITPAGYNEGAFMLKRKGVYYLMWSSYDTRDPRYCVNYATGPSPTGPFTSAGNNSILKQSGNVKAAGHHSVVQVPGKDEWFIAYHRFRIPDGNGYNREVCISPMRFESDGSIRAVDVFEPAYAYLMAYFGPEQKLFYAYSHDARNWTALNGGKSVWSPPFVRDPYLQRVNGKFHLVHTTGWTGATIGHWESDDLVDWTGGPIEVVGREKQKCWAPEFAYCDKEKVFYVFWASVHDGHHAMHYLKTSDWKNITPDNSSLYFDIGIHNIDLTIVEHEGTHYGFHKPGDVGDRMGNRLSTSASLDPGDSSFCFDKHGHGRIVFDGEIKPTEGPEVIKLVNEEKWYIYGDPFNSEMQAWETTDFKTFTRISVSTPRGAKHCSMLPITHQELQALRERYL